MDKQKIFDTVVEHLRKQGEKSIRADTCCYRGTNKQMCAIGCLIPDEKYSEEMEGFSLSFHTSDIFQDALKHLDVDLMEHDHLWFLRDLQRIHDLRTTSSWEHEWKEFANRYNVKYTPAPMNG